MKNLETFYTDATCYESDMRYPTDQKLLWECVAIETGRIVKQEAGLNSKQVRLKELNDSP